MMHLRFVPRAALLAALSSASILSAGCGDDPEPGRFDRLALRAEEVRELQFARDVPVRTISREQYLAEQEAAAAEIDDAELAAYAATYGRLGFFPMDADLRAIFGVSRDWVGAYYDSEAEEIVLLGEVKDELIVHELVHGLQDQHFDLGALADRVSTSDAYLGLKATVEGDAVLSQDRFVLQEKYDADLHQTDWAQHFAGWRRWSRDLLAEAEVPPIFVAYPSFAYTFGLEYSANRLVGATVESPTSKDTPPFDWSKENALFSDQTPETTQQVLALDGEDPPVEVGVTDVPASLADRLERIDWDSLGEWYTYILFYGLDGAQGIGDVRALAGAWDGDLVLFVRDLQTDAIGYAWASAWDDDAGASRVEAALWSLHAASSDATEPRLGEAGDGEPVWIERRGERVTVLKNVAPELLPALAEATFSAAAQPMRLTPRARPSLSAWLVKQVREHDDRRVLHLRLQNDAPGVERHGEALARALRVPHDADSAAPLGP